MSFLNPEIISVASALPPHRVGQEEAKEFARGMFGEVYRDIERLASLFDNVHVESRHFCVPVEWFTKDHTIHDKNVLYVEYSLVLSEK